LADFFVATYPEFMASRGAASVYDLTPESLRLLCESEDTLLVGAQRDGELCAAALFGFTRYLGDYLFGISNVYGRGFSAALIWDAALDLRRRGVPFLNLGGGVVEGDGVAEFKRRFGADEMPLMSVKEIYLRDVYRQLCERADVDPDDGRYFPAYRRPRAT
jgi:lipid II:glycine glycyltransferase (peptidoglycan interpeptide bridge formation enzyme)